MTIQNYTEKPFSRDDEIKRIKELLTKANHGKPCFAFVSGPSGVGKTHLVMNTVNSLICEKNVFIYSKFDEYNSNRPYYPFTQLGERLVQYTLTMPKNEVETNLKKVETAFRTDFGLLLNLVPELKNIIERENDIKCINPKSQKIHIENIFCKIVKMFATKDHPIILFIDDLQWADESSLNFIEYLCCNLKDEHLFVICAFRDSPKINDLLKNVESINKKNFCLEHIQVNHFTFQQTYDFVLQHKTDFMGDINKIAPALYKKTLGNLFYICQIMADFNKTHEFNHSCVIPENIVHAIIDKIAKLPEETKETLQYAAIIGNTFSSDILSQILGCTNDEVLLSLRPAYLAGMIIPSETSNEFDFVHDKIRENLILMIDQPTQLNLHLSIGRALLCYYENDLNRNLLIEVLHHFILGKELVEDKVEKIELAEYFVIVGNALLKICAYSEAIKYFETGIQFIKDEKTGDQHSLKYHAYLGYATALFLDGEHSQAEEAFDLAIAYTKDKIDFVKVLRCKTVLYFSESDHEKTISTGLAALSAMNIHISPEPLRVRTVLKMGEFIWIFRNIQDKCTDNSPKKDSKNDAVKLDILIDILCSLSLSAIVYRPELFKILMLTIGQLSATSKNPKNIPLSCTAYGIMAGSVFYHIEKERKTRDLSLELTKKYGRSSCSYYTDFTNTLFVNYWLDDWQKNIACFDTIYETAMEDGAFTFATCARTLKLNYFFCTGTNLDDLISEARKAKEQADQLKAKYYVLYASRMMAAYEAIKLLDIKCLEEEFWDKNHILMHSLIKMEIYFLNGEYQNAIKLVKRRNKNEEVLTAVCQYADFVFYQSLIIIASGNWGKIKYKIILHKNMRKLRKWFESCSNNFGHKYYLVSAEVARANKRSSEAADLYKRAVLSAAENGFTQNEAVASELAGKFFYSIGNWQKAETYINNAYVKYKQWGIKKKLNLLEQEYPFLNIKDKPATANTFKQEKNNWDKAITEVLKTTMQENNPNELLERILDMILSIGCADKVSLLSERNGEPYILLIRNSHHISSFNGIFLSEYRDLPQKLIYYTFNTAKTIIIEHDRDKGVFINDPYIKEHAERSELCIPLIFHKILLGALYLEKCSNFDEDLEECIEVIKALSCQSVLLEKLQIFIDSENKNSDANSMIIEGLTPRETDILRYIAAGHSNKEIADSLGLSVNTVKTHILNIYSKMDVNNRSQAAVKAKDFNLV